jgi:hypothetical protein
MEFLTHRAVDDLLDLRSHACDSGEHAIRNHLAIAVHATLSGNLGALHSGHSSTERTIDDAVNVSIKVLGLVLLVEMSELCLEVLLNILDHLGMLDLLQFVLNV